jgi:site-specific DNA recombinase
MSNPFRYFNSSPEIVRLVVMMCAVLTDALRDAHHWLDELTTSPNLNIESLAAREGKTERWIRRILSLAFLCPALVKAVIDGRLPRGFEVKRLMDLPMAWPDQQPSQMS